MSMSYDEMYGVRGPIDLLMVGERKAAQLGYIDETEYFAFEDEVVDKLPGILGKASSCDGVVSSLKRLAGCEFTETAWLTDAEAGLSKVEFGNIDAIRFTFYLGSVDEDDEWFERKVVRHWQPDTGKVSSSRAKRTTKPAVKTEAPKGACVPSADGVLESVPEDAVCFAIPEGTVEVAPKAFCGCVDLPSLSVPDGLKKMRAELETVSRLDYVEAPSLEAWLGIAFRNAYCNPLRRGAKLVISGEEVVDLVVPKELKVGRAAFAGCGSIKSVELDGVKSVGADAFVDCCNLRSVVFSKGLKSISDGAFCGCSNLSSVVIPSGVTKIGRHAFAGKHNQTLVLHFEGDVIPADLYVADNHSDDWRIVVDAPNVEVKGHGPGIPRWAVAAGRLAAAAREGRPFDDECRGWVKLCGRRGLEALRYDPPTSDWFEENGL